MRILKFCILLFLLNLQSVFGQEIFSDSTLSGNCIDFEIVADSTVAQKVVKDRLSTIQRTIPLRYHAVTHQYIDVFAFKKHEFVRRMLEHSPQFFTLYEQKLAEYGLPDELKYLSLIESGLNPRIISYAGAGGLWQFMPATGREFGMYQDGHIDERFDPEKATEGACRYFRQLYRIFGDWEMVLAAYNTGPGNVKRAMRQSGSNTFWGIYNHLPKQTRMYVPQFVAIMYMMHYHADHNIHAVNPVYPILSDTIQVTGHFDVLRFSELTDVSLDEFYRLNPQVLKTDLGNNVTRKITLRVPNYRTAFIQENRLSLWDSISRPSPDATIRFATTTTEILKNESTVVTNNVMAQLANTTQQNENKARTRYHKVQAGDTLWKISERYGISFDRLKKINRLRGNSVKKGQKLLVTG